MAWSAARSAASVQKSLATATRSSEPRPRSSSQAASRTRSRAAARSAAMSASAAWTIWKSPIRRPNCRRRRAKSTEASRQACSTPTAPAATPRRPRRKALVATRWPSPGRPNTASSPSSRPWKLRTAWSAARWPRGQPGIGRRSSPGESVGTTKAGPPASPAVGPPVLLPLQTPASGDAHRARPQAAHVGARLRLGEGVAPDGLAAAQPRQPVCPLGRASPLRQAAGHQGHLDRHQPPHAGVDAPQLLRDQAAGQGGVALVEQTPAAQVADQLPIEASLGVGRPGDGGQQLLGRRPGPIPRLQQRRREREVHPPQRPRKTGGRPAVKAAWYSWKSAVVIIRVWVQASISMAES